VNSRHDAVVVGSGPNGLTAAVVIAQTGRSVLVLEAADVIGGGTRTAELTLPGFRHDVCSAIHPLGAASPAFAALPLEEHGLEWVHPHYPLAHPRRHAPAVLAHRSVHATVEGLGADGAAYRSLIGPLADDWDLTRDAWLGPMLRVPRHPVALGRFGLRAVRSGAGLARRFPGDAGRSLFVGCAAHSVSSLRAPFSSAVALVLLAAAHRVGWPAARRGSAAITEALESLLRSLGGEVRTGHVVRSLADVPPARAVLFDTSAAAMSRIADQALPRRYRRALRRLRPAPGAFKIDWALDGPIPWSDERVARAGTVHVGGDCREIADAEEQVVRGRHPDRPFVLVAQQSAFDDARAPQGAHTGWGYCHVPTGSTVDMTDRIEAQIERYAPGFRDRILARHVLAPSDLEAMNANYTGGDITGGAISTRQLVARPVARPDPYRAGRSGLYLCSASAPPGAGVHGMAGYHAARSALRHSLR
jgi:phytoene dehydrogenase-like protein